MRLVPLYEAFPGEARDVLRLLIPEVMVDADAIQNRPTIKDPLGGEAQLKYSHCVEWRTNSTLLRFELNGDNTMPWLEHKAAAVYLCVNWPEIFSMRGER